MAKATGVGSRSGRPVNARRLRVVARRMFETISADSGGRHESALLTAESDRAEAETWCTLSDNGDGTYAGRFVIPELHGLILKTALDRLTAPRHTGAAAAAAADGADGRLVTDPTPDLGPELVRTIGDGAAGADRTPPADRRVWRDQHGRGPGHPRLRQAPQWDRCGRVGHRRPDLGPRRPPAGLQRRPDPRRPRRPVPTPRPGPHPSAALRYPTQGARLAARLLCDRHL